MVLIHDLNKHKKAAILFPAFLKGGAESVALWILDSLKSDFDLTLVTFSSLDFDKLNRMYSCNLKKGDFKIDVPYAHTPLPSILTAGYSYFTPRQHILLRYFKRVKDQYALVIGAYNEMDFGKPGVQYLNSPMFGPEHEKARALLGYPDSGARHLYHRFFEKISGFSTQSMKSNISVANSAWAAQLFKKIYQMEVGVLYPPVIIDTPDVPWEKREAGFVCISRMVPEKQIEKAINIIGRVRAKGFDVHLHIISSNFEPSYRKTICEIQSQNSNWIFINENLSRTELAGVLSMHRYGLHVRENEQFGISVEEMVRAGCIPFIPENGGPAEIVGDLRELEFGTVESASDIICGVLSNKAKEQDLLARLAVRKGLFSIDHFRRELSKIVEKALSKPFTTP
jgi:glycosyltransferase involved in cell wall biosynthesis